MTQIFETISLATDARGIARLVLNRPAKHNALNAAMISEITEAANALAHDKRVRALVLSANGTSFCAGGDLGWMQAQSAADRAERMAEASHLARMLQLLDELPKLLIGVIEGPAFGGGVGLASVCDIILATPEARFALTETRLGLIPATISPFVIRRIGLANARRFALNANPFNAETAHAIGLVSEIHAAADIGAALERQIGLALACAPGAIADTKRLFRAVASGSLSQTSTVEALADRWESEEARQGIEAFFQQRKPPWAV